MQLSLRGLGPLHRLLLLGILIAGLAIDVGTDLPGQVVLSVAIWIALFYVLAAVEPHERWTLWTCLVIATAGELFLSLLWGLYTYRLGNIPFFIPPGHVMLLILAISLAPHLPKIAADAILAGAALYGLIAAAAGVDTFALPLVVFLVIVAVSNPEHRPLYASTFVLALALELYGTWLGNWTWAREVPVIGLTTTNPPGIVSAFYAVLDAIVASLAVLLGRRLANASRAAARLTN